MKRRRWVRAAIGGLALTAMAALGLALLPGEVLQRLVLLWITRPAAPTPPPPTIESPRGPLPSAAVGLQEWAKYEGGDYRPVGSGFLLRLADGAVVAVATAHSVGDVGEPSNTLMQVAFTAFGREGFVVESDVLYGPPGLPRTGDDLTVDWVLLKVDSEIDPGWVLDPDPRGGPQPGERVRLYSGRGDGVTVGGTVQTVEPQAVWVLMDPIDYPGGMSGSPLLSEHTGLVVGMAVAVTPRGDRYLIGFHPTASLVSKAALAADFPKIVEYHR